MLAASPISGPIHPWIGRRSSVRAPAKLKFRQRSGRNEAQGGELSGSDVLRALQRASVKKSKKQSSKEQASAQALRIGSEQDASGGAHAQAQAPGLRIKAEWRFQLEELDKRLRQIMLLDQP